MTKAELKESLDSFGAPHIPARISEAIPDDLPQVVIAGVLFVLCEDGPVCFDTEQHCGRNAEFLPDTMKDGQAAIALWRLGWHNVLAFEQVLHDWWGDS